MRFGGHETFSIREGWLHKGLALLVQEPEKLVHEFAADWLGVGLNMSRSIRHWLVATGLARRTMVPKSLRVSSMAPTKLAERLFKSDPYFLDTGTWWLLHTNLVNCQADAFSWSWFFNHSNLTRFEKPVCVEGLRRHIELGHGRLPASRTLDRDIACLLTSYARRVPAEPVDPEDGRDCPFRELGLMTHHPGSGYYEVHLGPKTIRPELVGYALSLSMEETRHGPGTIDIPLQIAAAKAGGPGRVFALTPESLFEVIAAIDSDAFLSQAGVELAGHAGERVIRVAKRRPEAWVTAYFRAVAKEERVNAA